MPERERLTLPALRRQWGVASGQLWEVPSRSCPGRCHRLLCGDATDAAAAAAVMAGERADLCVTSPPYDRQRRYEGGLGDWQALMRGAFGHLPVAPDGQVLVNLGLIYRGGEWLPYWEPWLAWMAGRGWRRFGWYVWDQGSGLPGAWHGRLAPSFEFVFHLNRRPRPPRKWVPKKPWNCRRPASSPLKSTGHTRRGGSAGPGWTNPDKIPDAVVRLTRQVGPVLPGVEHPAVFPVALPAFVMRSWPGVVYEPFAGSGSTLVAGEETGNPVRAVEISANYCALCLQRLRQIGLEPRLVAARAAARVPAA